MRVPAAAGAPVIDRGSPAFARRIAAFDKVAVTGIKELVDRAALPTVSRPTPAPRSGSCDRTPHDQTASARVCNFASDIKIAGPGYAVVRIGQGGGTMEAQPMNSPTQRAGGAVAGTNVMAILALVFAFIFAPLGIVFGAVAKRQIRRTGEQGAGLAKAGFWLGIIFTVLSVLWVVYDFIMAASQTTA
jgi:hypothetical protein